MYTIISLITISLAAVAYSKEYCIIGAGPSGLQMGYFLERAGRDYIIYERDPSPGWFFKVYPRHRMLISINKRHTGKTNKEFNMRHDWNSLLSDDDDLLMTKYSKEFFPPADTLVQYLKDFAEKLNLKMQYNTYIVNVEKNSDSSYELKDRKGNTYSCKNLIVSTGAWVENLPKNVSGIEHTEGYAKMSINPDDYEGQTILVIGRGNSGFETAQHLQGATNLIHMLSRTRVKFAWETHYVGDVRAVNDGPIDTYQLKSLDGQMEGDLSTIKFVKKKGKIYLVFADDGEEGVMPDNIAVREGYDRVLRCTGFKMDRSIFNVSARPVRHNSQRKFPLIKPNYESQNNDNMFFTGVITHSLDFRKSAGAFIHGFRYTTRALARYLEWRNHQIKWPSTSLPDLELLNFLIKRLNEASGTYQMFSNLCDVILLNENGTFVYLEEIPIGMLHKFEEHTGHKWTRGIVVNLEYGKNFSGPGSDPFKDDRATGEAQEAHTSNFLHPVLYYYPENPPPLVNYYTLPRPVRLHHMVEDFLTEWVAPVSHILPLRWFLEHCLGKDLRHFYAETCFEYAMTGMTLPPSCQADYMAGTGLPKPFMDVTSTTSV